MGLSRLDQPFVTGSVQTPVERIPQVSSSLAWTDRLGTYKARWGVGRMHYTVQPGLYALGNPDQGAPVAVTANYKMSFDFLRRALPGRDLWILVLDTNGINVWCAAGKGTFGTSELVEKIESSGLARVVSHRQLILPQLAGPGIAAHLVKRLSGFEVIYGPIRAEDLPAFLDNGRKATPKMRTKTFTLLERVVLIPVELVGALKAALIVVPVLLLLSGFLGPAGFWDNLLGMGLFTVPAILTAIAAGAVMAPILLPWLPGRAFSVKGIGLGILGALFLLMLRWHAPASPAMQMEMAAWILLVPAAATYLSMNFTGASTYTSLSGVKKETRRALPIQIGAVAVGLALWISSILLA